LSRRTLLVVVSVLASLPAYALYDPKPAAELSGMQGEWRGQLTYDDYSEPGHRVTLPTTLFAALSTPNALTLHFVFDDGPGKTVHSYEQLTFDFALGQVAWSSGGEKPEVQTLRIVSKSQEGDRVRVEFASDEPGHEAVHSLAVDTTQLTLKKEEVDGNGARHFRNEYRFQRAGP
jgi:hypothetical protein